MDKANILLSNSNDLNDVYDENYPETNTITSGEMSQRQRQGKRVLKTNGSSKIAREINRATGKFEDEDSLNLPMVEY